jgi:MFS family permease
MNDRPLLKPGLRSAVSVLQNKWTMALLLSLGLAMDYQARVALNSIFPLLRKDLLMTDLQIGLTATAFLWTYGLLSPVAGYFGDRFPRRTVLIGSVTCWNVVTLLSGFVTSAWQLIAMRAVLALAQVCYVPTAQALVTDFHGKETQGKAIGIFQAGCYAGIFLAGLPAAYVATHLGWRMMFRLSGGIGLLLAGLMLALPGEKKDKARAAEHRGERSPQTSVRGAISLLRIRSILAIMLAFALSSGAYWILFTYLPLFIYERHHLGLVEAAFLATFCMQVSAMVLDPLLGHVADKWSARNAKNRFWFCALAGLVGLPALTAVGLGSHVVILIAGLVLFGMASAGADVSWMPMLSYVTRKYQRATAFGYLNMAACLAGGLTATLTALLMKRYGLGLLIASGGMMFLLLALILLVAAHAFLYRDIVPEDSDESLRQNGTLVAESAARDL